MTDWTVMSRLMLKTLADALLSSLILAVGATGVRAAEPDAERELAAYQLQTLGAAIRDLIATFGERYPRGAEFLRRWEQLQEKSSDPGRAPALAKLRQEALLANPLLNFERLLVVKRRVRTGPKNRPFPEHSREYGHALGLPSNHECNSSLPRTGYDNELASLSPLRPDGPWQTLFRPADGGYVGEMDLHVDADRLLFSRSDAVNWQIWEIHADGSGLRQVSSLPADVDCFDACYLPNDKIVFGSTASYQAVPCWHGQKWVSNLYLMSGDGSGVRQLCFDQDHDFHPAVLPNGQVIYHRWDYTGINHIFQRQLMVMNPDGTGQRAIYGSNSWYPNALYFPRAAGESGQLACILSGYHGVHRMGQLVRLDTTRGWHEAEGLVQRISGRGDALRPLVRDNLVDQDWPKFLQPFPLSDKYLLVSARLHDSGNWGIYLADTFDNLLLLREEPGYALLEPVPLRKSARPPVLPDRVDLARHEASVYLHDVYAGPGLQGVPRGTVRSLRVIAYHFGYRNLAGPDKIGYGGPWEVMRILGTVPLQPDGSAHFRVPANTPLAVQPLDAEGQAVQLMRSWFTAMPGETVSCVGCHERPADAPTTPLALAARQPPRELTPWHGAARGFDFAREVQPVLDRYCASCHDGQHPGVSDLRALPLVKDYRGRRVSQMEVDRLPPQVREASRGILRYTPAYEALLPYVRRVGIEDDVSLLTPGEYHADTSPLVQLLRKGHHGVDLDAEAWERLVTWIDLNAPCHGTWGEVYPVPEGAHQRRRELRQRFGGPAEDPEMVPLVAQGTTPPTGTVAGGGPGTEPAVRPPSAADAAPSSQPPVSAAGWPFAAAQARQRQHALGQHEMTVTLGAGVTLRLVRVPAGEFVMGDAEGAADERPLARVVIRQPFWLGACEVSNAQFRCFDVGHNSGYYAKRHARSDDQGLSLDGPQQPAVRVSWEQALAFCHWLSSRTGKRFTLPTEAQWEYACRAGSAAPLSFGPSASDFSRWANVADQALSVGLIADGKQITGGLEHLVLEGAGLCDTRFQDGAVVTADVGSRQPNAWGLYDLHGNAAEWTLSAYQPYPYGDDDGRNDPARPGRKVVRGGSFFDHPRRCRSAYRLDYPSWRRLFNVGFRVIAEEPAKEAR